METDQKSEISDFGVTTAANGFGHLGLGEIHLSWDKQIFFFFTTASQRRTNILLAMQ